MGVRGVEHCPAGRSGAETDREAFEIVAPAASSACAVAASERRVWSTRASAHAAVRSHTTRAMRAFPVFAARSCSAVSASCCSQTGCAFTTALTCGLVQSFCGIGRSFVRGGACIVERTREPRQASRTSHAPHAVVMWAGVRGRAARARPCDSVSKSVELVTS